VTGTAAAASPELSARNYDGIYISCQFSDDAEMITSTPIEVRGIAMSVSVFECLSVRAHIRELHVQTSRNFLYVLSVWFGPPLTTMQYTMYFRFCE